MIKSLKNKFSKYSRAILFTALTIICCFFLFLIYYINNINIYGDFSLEIYQNDINISDQVTVKGISFLGREHELEYHSGRVHSETWYYKELRIYIPDSVDKNNLYITSYSDEYEYNFDFEVNLFGNNSKILKEFDVNRSFIDKLLFLTPLNYLVVVRCLILVFSLLLLSCFVFVKKNNKLQEVFINIGIDKIRYFFYIIILFSGVILRFSNPLVTLFAFDYSGHIGPVIKYFLFEEFSHYEWSYPYPLFIFIMLSIFKDINSICIIHHLLSTFSVVAFLFFLEFKFRSYFKNIKNEVIYSIITILTFDLLFLNKNLIIYEKNLHHEGLIIPSIILITIMLFVYFNKKNLKYSLLIFTFTIFTIFLMILLHYRLTVGLFIIAVIILIKELSKKWKISKKNIILPIIIFFTFFVIIFGIERYLVNKYDKFVYAFPYTQFVYSNAKTVLKAIDSNQTVEPDFDSVFLKKYINQSILNENSRWYPILQYNFDYLKYDLARPNYEMYIAERYFYESTIYSIRENEDSINKYINIYNNYYKDWAKLLLLKYPINVVKKTLRQFIFVFFYPDLSYIEPSYKKKFINPLQNNYGNCQYYYLSKEFNYKQGKIKINFPKSKNYYYILMNFLIRLFFIVSLIYAIILLIKKRISYFILSIFIIIITTMFTIAFLHTFDIIRYMHTLLPIILFFILFCSIDFMKKMELNEFKK